MRCARLERGSLKYHRDLHVTFQAFDLACFYSLGVKMKSCPCGTTKTYLNCCGLFISGKQVPMTPEELMRSRYTAYTKAKIHYIVDTMKEPASSGFNISEAFRWAKEVTWKKLEVISSQTTEDKGLVEFKAYYTFKNKPTIMHELSEFSLIDGRWFYVNGKQGTE